jgi:surfeit locus 1 family protein
MVRFRPLPMLTLMAVAALVVLIMFGRWQWAKYAAESQAQAAPPLEVTLGDYEPLPEAIQLVYGALGSAPGWRVLTPVRAEGRTVFVDAAFEPGPDPPTVEDLRLPGSLAHGVAITGVSVAAEGPGGSAFTAAPEPERRVWYALDLAGMAQAAGLSGEVDTDTYIALPYIGEDGRPVPNPFVLGRMDQTPPEQHLGYAMTWWGLAVVLLGVYFAYHVSAGRLRFGRGAA